MIKLLTNERGGGQFSGAYRSQKRCRVLEKKDKWQDLCEQAAVEQNPEKLLELTKEINGLLEEKKNDSRKRVSKLHKKIASRPRAEEWRSDSRQLIRPRCEREVAGSAFTHENTLQEAA
jgi:hypothetical protein